MKKNLFYFAILFLFHLLVSCKSATIGNNSNSSKIEEVVGKWQESWDNDKSSADIYSLKVKGEKLTIACVTHKYQFQNISFQNNILRFKLINTDKYINETYIIDYEISFQADKKIFAGKAKTSKGVTAKILWEEII